MARPDGFGEQIVLRGEMGIERAARQAGRQHDVVDVGAGMAAQAEQPCGMIEDFGPGTGLAGGVLGHDMLFIISYDNQHITGVVLPDRGPPGPLMIHGAGLEARGPAIEDYAVD